VLRFADGSSAAGAPVDILYAAAGSGGAYAPLATAHCAADGSWTTTVDLPRTGTIRARFPGDATRAALESSSLKITLVPKLSMFLSSRRFRRGRRVRVSGYLAPATSARVDLLLERKVAGRYRRVRRRRLPVRDTRFQRFLRPSRPGLYRITVSVDGASTRQYVRVT
jgi:hypothetical protein